MPQIIINITDAQQAVLNGLRAPSVEAENTPENQLIRAYEVIDDNQVTLYSIAPDGTYTYESLENGFNQGWTTFDSDGQVVKDE